MNEFLEKLLNWAAASPTKWDAINEISRCVFCDAASAWGESHDPDCLHLQALAAQSENRDKDVTQLVSFENNDDEMLPLTVCVCGAEYPAWEFILGIYRDMARKCACGRRLYFSNGIRVYEVVDSPVAKTG
jgi:hypothetical protein